MFAGKWLLLVVSSLLVMVQPSQAEKSQPGMMPYMLLAQAPGKIEQVIPRLRVRLQNANFRILSEHAPFENAHIFSITSDRLIQTAAKSRYGALGAVLKVGVAQLDQEVQVMANDPEYIGSAYRLGDNLSDIKKAISSIGYVKDFGSKPIPKEELEDYNYMFGLETFSDFYELAKHSSYEVAVKKVEAGLRKKYMGISKVYRQDIPGKQFVPVPAYPSAIFVVVLGGHGSVEALSESRFLIAAILHEIDPFDVVPLKFYFALFPVLDNDFPD